MAKDYSRLEQEIKMARENNISWESIDRQLNTKLMANVELRKMFNIEEPSEIEIVVGYMKTREFSKYFQVAKLTGTEEQLKLLRVSEGYTLEIKEEYRIKLEKDLSKVLLENGLYRGKEEIEYKDHTYQLVGSDFKNKQGNKIYIVHQDGKKEPCALFSLIGDYWVASTFVGVTENKEIKNMDCIVRDLNTVFGGK